MFNKDFYPTPEAVCIQMLSGSNLQDKIVYEPHGGKGDLISAIKKAGAKEVLTSEINPDLAKVCSQKADIFVGTNVFAVEDYQISHVDFIIFNYFVVMVLTLANGYVNIVI